MIAMALSCRPALLIADEPTTALDVTIQAQILELIASCSGRCTWRCIFITHDMGVVAEIADRVVVMYGAKRSKTARSDRSFTRRQHPYTRALLAAVPQLGAMRGTDAPRKFPAVREPAHGAPPATPRP